VRSPTGGGASRDPTTAGAAGWGLALVSAATVSWGTTGAVMAAVGHRGTLSPLAVGSLRLAIAGPLLLALARVTGAFGERRLPPHLPRLALMGAAQAAFQVGYFGAVPHIGVASTALVAICASPILIAALAVWILGERLTARVLLAMGGGIAGTVLLVGGRLNLGGITPAVAAIGTGLALGAAVAYALYVVLAKALVGLLPPFAITGVSFALGAVFLLPAALAEPALWTAVRPVWPHLAYLGIVPTALAYALYIRGLQTTSATAASVCALLEPLTASVIGLVVFGESMGPQGFAGGALLLGAVAYLLLGAPSRG